MDIHISLGMALSGRFALEGPGGEVLVTVGTRFIVPEREDEEEKIIALRIYLVFTSFECVVHTE